MEKQKKLAPNKSLTMASMHINRASTIISNWQLALLATCFILFMGSVIYPLLSMFNYILAFLAVVVSIIFSLGLILIKIPFDVGFNQLIIFPFETNELVFTLLAKILPVTGGILIGFSIATFVTQIINKERKAYRIICSILGVIFAIIAMLVKFE